MYTMNRLTYFTHYILWTMSKTLNVFECIGAVAQFIQLYD